MSYISENMYEESLYMDDDIDGHYIDEEDVLSSYYLTDDLIQDVDMADTNYNLANARIIFKYCLLPSIQQTVEKFYPIIIAAVLTRLLQTTSIPSKLKHLISISMSLALLFRFFPVYLALYFISLVVLTIPILSRRCLILLVCGLHLVIGQLFMDKETWLSIRGAEMILLMKAVSLTMSIDRKIDQLSVIDYLTSAYSSIFGPWMSYSQFMESYSDKTINLGGLKYAVFSLISLSFSNCLFSLVEDHIGSNLVLSTYFKAFSFRQSHYFICYFAQFLISIANMRSTVTRQWKIEIPRSLLDVVTSWNLPMHYWLKTFVFAETRRRFGTCVALFATYFVSSLLHGFDVNIVLVLFSLALFTYVELNFRIKLSRVLNSCVQVRECKPGQCRHKQGGLFTTLVNFMFLVINIWHLAYLGQLFYFEGESTIESNTIGLALSKWAKTYYSSHVFVFVQLIITKFI